MTSFEIGSQNAASIQNVGGDLTIADLLQDATTVIGGAEGLATAGAGLVESLRRAATLLGPAGKTLLTLLPLL